MKTCGYCAEEIREAAVVCRYCGRPYLVGVEAVLYMGRVYAIGRTASHYAVWNMVTGGSPVLQNDLTDPGWEKTWTRYSAAEQGEKPSKGGLGVGGFVAFGEG